MKIPYISNEGDNFLSFIAAIKTCVPAPDPSSRMALAGELAESMAELAVIWQGSKTMSSKQPACQRME